MRSRSVAAARTPFQHLHGPDYLVIELVEGETLAARPQGVTVDRIRYESGKPSQLVLSGYAPRYAVNHFRTALTDTGKFTSVSVPVGALVGTDDSGFSVTMMRNF